MSDTRGAAPKKSLFSLIGAIPTLISNLIKAEIESFKLELTGKLKAAGIGIGLLVGAATFLFFALLVFIAAAVLGLATVLPAWAAALIVGGAILLIGVILGLIGVVSLRKGVPPTPTKTLDSIGKDVRTIQGTERRSK